MNAKRYRLAPFALLALLSLPLCLYLLPISAADMKSSIEFSSTDQNATEAWIQPSPTALLEATNDWALFGNSTKTKTTALPYAYFNFAIPRNLKSFTGAKVIVYGLVKSQNATFNTILRTANPTSKSGKSSAATSTHSTITVKSYAFTEVDISGVFASRLKNLAAGESIITVHIAQEKPTSKGIVKFLGMRFQYEAPAGKGGETGATGTNGTDGAPGKNGTDGAAGIGTYQRIFDYYEPTLSPGGAVGLSLSCPDGSYVVGGGAMAWPAEWAVNASYPMNDNTWAVWFYSAASTGSASVTGKVAIYSICTTVAPQ